MNVLCYAAQADGDTLDGAHVARCFALREVPARLGLPGA